MRLGAARFVAGETLDQAVPVLRALNQRGLVANTTLLGESVHDRSEAESVAAEYLSILDRLAAEQLQCHVALKLTHLGLELDEGLALENVARVVRHAAEVGNFVRIDMEQSAFVEVTLRIYRALREERLDNVGTVLQSYLYRTEEDLRSLLPLRPNLRIVKGAYLEPPDIAYPAKEDVDAAYRRLLDIAFESEGYTAVATHDETLIDYTLGKNLPKERFELQMLYGVRPALQTSLAQRGHTVRVATPFGPDWYPYLMRRLAERPANLGFFLRATLSR